MLLAALALLPASARAWLFQFPGQRPTAARSLEFAPDGTVVAAGDFAFLQQRTFGLVRIEPGHGQASGFAFLDLQHDGVANALAMFGNDAIAAGEVASDEDASEFAVARFGPFGNIIWSTRLNGNASCGADVANALAIDVELGVFAAGQVTNTGNEANSTVFTIVK